MADDPKTRMRSFVKQVQNDGDVDAVDDYMADDFVDHSAVPGFPPGPAGAKALFAAIRLGFPDHNAVVHEMISEGDLVATRKSFMGTHKGEFFGVPATGRTATIDVIDFVRFRDGKIAEHWNIVDMAGLMRQLGVSE